MKASFHIYLYGRCKTCHAEEKMAVFIFFVISLVFTVFTVYNNNDNDKEAAEMATKALNFKMDEAEILDMKEVAGVFNMSVTDLVRNAVKEYLTELKKDPFYRLTVNVQEASAEESEEILAEIEGMSDDDLTIASSKGFTV